MLSAVYLPSSLQLQEFPDSVKEEVTRIAFSVLRRLFYPILEVYVARRYRRKVVKEIIDRTSLPTIESKINNAIKHLSVLSTRIESSEMADDVSENISVAIRQVMSSVTYSLFVQHEIIQYTGEPSKSVAFILSGTGKRIANIKAKEKPSNGQINSPYAGSTQASNSNRSSRTSSNYGGLRCGSMNGLPAALQSKEKLLHAPSMFGELTVVGGYSCSDVIVADSSLVFVAYMPKKAFCDVLSAFPRPAQRRMMQKALNIREAQLLRHSPMTCGRMRICPLLTGLGDSDVMHLLDYLVPRVYPAGTRVEDDGRLKHIYFIRRGVVYLKKEEDFLDNHGAPSQPMSRCLLSEGHTFGERQCIFNEALGDIFYTVTNVDMYLLPFSVLIQFMKQQPDAREVIYQAAKNASLLLEKEYNGMRFHPSTMGNFPTVLLSTAGSLHISKWFQRRVSIISAPPSTVRTASGTPFSNSGLDIFHEPRKVSVSPQFVENLRKMPLVSLYSPDDRFYEECAKCWKLFTHEAGEYIVRSGEECNRLLLFNGEGAVVVTDGHSMSREKKQDLSMYSGFPRVPTGCIIGYTCVWRHAWAHSILALDSQVEVWELNRQTFVDLLRRHRIERYLQSAALQLIQPLVPQNDRSIVLDYQPLLTPSPNSLWSEQRIPNMHPVSLCESLRYQVWKEGCPLVDNAYSKRRGSRRTSKLSPLLELHDDLKNGLTGQTKPPALDLDEI